jgi:hypothetical protein
MQHSNYTVPSLFINYSALIDANSIFPFGSNLENSLVSFSLINYRGDSNIVCRHVSNSNGTKYYKLTFSIFPQCTIKVQTISKGSLDESFIGMYVNTSTSFGGESGFYLSQNFSFLAFKDPLVTSFPNIFYESQFPFKFSLNLTKLTGPFQISLVANSNGAISNSNITFTDFDNCWLRSWKTFSAPILFYLRILIADLSFNTVGLSSKYYYFRENVTMSQTSPYPFLIDPTKNTTRVEFSITKQFDNNFNFYCLDKRNMTTISAILIYGVIYCDIASFGVNEILLVDIHVNSSVFEPNTLMVKDLELRFDQLKIFPKYFEKNQNLHLQIQSNDSANYVVPLKYQNSFTDFKLRSSSGKDVSCSLNSTHSLCYKSSLIDSNNYNVYLIHFTFMYEANVIFNISEPILNYESNGIDANSRAQLVGKNKTFVLKFNSKTLNIDPRIIKVEYFCKVSENNEYYVASKMDESQLNCSIPYIGINKLTLSTWIKVPSVSNDYLLISNNSISVYYIDQKSINFNFPTTPLFYTSSEVTLTFLINTELDSSLLNKLRCRVNTTTIYTSNIVHISSNGNKSHVFNCSYSSLPIGRIQAFVEFFENDERFSLSSNSLDIVLVSLHNFQGFNPPVSITNVTNNVNMKTNFPSKDYGNARFIAKFGFESDPYHNRTLETNFTTILDSYQFTSDFNIQNPSTYQLSIWIEVYGKELLVVSPISYKFIGNIIYLIVRFKFFDPKSWSFDRGRDCENSQTKNIK